MRVSRAVLAVAFALMCPSSAVFAGGLRDAGETDQVVAAQVLGPQWMQLSRRAGMIFSGTVLSTSAPGIRANRTVSTVELSFRVERAIAGVEPGQGELGEVERSQVESGRVLPRQVLTIHEWAGSWSALRPMHRGERILLFLYPPSRLGLTSPVGGAQGQIRLDANRNASLLQLERAIRSARGE